MSDAVTETYHDVERMLDKLAWVAYRKYGGSFEDHRSAADEGFMVAYRTYKPPHRFSTWCYWKVMGAIRQNLAYERRRERHRHRLSLKRVDPEKVPSRPDRWDVAEFLESLDGYDVRVVAEAIFESFGEVADLLHHDDIGDVICGGVYNRLRSVGWSIKRVAECLHEIREAFA